MKKKVFGFKLSRETDTRRALFRSLAKALILHGSIKTTKQKALAVRPFVEKLVSEAKKTSLASKRNVLALLGNDRNALEKLSKLAPAFSRRSGFVRLVSLIPRRGDGGEMVRLEWSEKINPNEKPNSKKDEFKKKVKK